MAQMQVVNTPSLVSALEYHGLINVHRELQDVLFERVLELGKLKTSGVEILIECNFAHLYERNDFDTVAVQFNLNYEDVIESTEDEWIVYAEWTGYINLF